VWQECGKAAAGATVLLGEWYYVRSGFAGQLDSQLTHRMQNMTSTVDHPKVIDSYLTEKCSIGRELGP